MGTVGNGVAQVLARNAEEISRRAGRDIVISHAAVRNLERPNPTAIKLTDDPLDVVRNPEIAVVVELIGGYDPARHLVLEAIANGKHVVTANKALIALHGNDIFAAAHQAGLMVAFEAAVAGGIPIIKAIREGLTGNQIQWLAGIINGTGNFIMTEMRDKGRDFDQGAGSGPGTGLCRGRSQFRRRGHRCRAQAYHTGFHRVRCTLAIR